MSPGSLVVIWQEPGISKSECIWYYIYIYISLCKNACGMHVALWRFKTRQLEVGIESKCPSAKAQGNSNEKHHLAAFSVGCDLFPPLKHILPSYIISLHSIGCLCASLCSAAWHPTGLLRKNGMLRFQDQTRNVLAWGLQSDGKTPRAKWWNEQFHSASIIMFSLLVLSRQSAATATEFAELMCGGFNRWERTNRHLNIDISRNIVP